MIVAADSLWGIYMNKNTYVVYFPRGSYLTDEAEMIIKDVSVLLAEDPDLNVKLTGYTSSKGDPEANLVLSKERAEVVKKELVYNGISEDRILAEGKGGTEPLKRNSSESDTEYKLRHSRVEIVIGRFLDMFNN